MASAISINQDCVLFNASLADDTCDDAISSGDDICDDAVSIGDNICDDAISIGDEICDEAVADHNPSSASGIVFVDNETVEYHVQNDSDLVDEDEEKDATKVMDIATVSDDYQIPDNYAIENSWLLNDESSPTCKRDFGPMGIIDMTEDLPKYILKSHAYPLVGPVGEFHVILAAPLSDVSAVKEKPPYEICRQTGMWNCKIDSCQESFRNKHKWYDHQRAQHGQYVVGFLCQFCRIPLASIGHSYKHVIDQHYDRLQEYRRLRFQMTYELRENIQYVTSKPVYKFPCLALGCRYGFSSAKKLRRHKKTCHPIRCFHCHSRFYDAKYLKIHLRAEHKRSLYRLQTEKDAHIVNVNCNRMAEIAVKDVDTVNVSNKSSVQAGSCETAELLAYGASADSNSMTNNANVVKDKELNNVDIEIPSDNSSTTCYENVDDYRLAFGCVKCVLCEELSDNIQHFKGHCRMNHPVQLFAFVCQFCSMKFKGKYQIKWHLLESHPDCLENVQFWLAEPVYGSPESFRPEELANLQQMGCACPVKGCSYFRARRDKLMRRHMKKAHGNRFPS